VEGRGPFPVQPKDRISTLDAMGPVEERKTVDLTASSGDLDLPYGSNCGDKLAHG
jgi:hypothetical protein